MELLRKQNQVLIAALETAYGTAASPTGANAILAQDLSVKMIDAQTQDRNNIVAWMGAQGAITVGRQITANFGIELAASGTAATPPAWGSVLMACGFAEVVGASDVAYTPVDESFSSLTMIYRIKTLQQRLIGSRGKVVFNLDQGTIPSAKYDFIGLYEDPSEETESLTGANYDDFKIPEGVTDVSTEVTLFGTPVAMRKLTIDPGVMMDMDRHTEGESVEVGGRSGSISISFRTDVAQLVDAIKKGSGNFEGPLQAVHGTEVGKTLTFDVPNVQVRTADIEWDGEFASVSMQADIKPLSANTDLSITQS
ncbi:phage tail tube protein [Thiomicrorhabdus indica]|uniref:phage tail tube protein n=1 Tax=Thiomicrorhabdus indica TaxID=2267253 RepID=UPI002AA6D71B|nr:phage tail tube protein [Thiomicrorhabdus indica]